MQHPAFINKYSTFDEQNFIIIVKLFFFIGVFLIISSNTAFAQINQGQQQLERSQQFRLGQRIIRVAQPGQLADSVNVWGDVNSPGRYLIPQNTTLPELLSYSLGPKTISNNQTQLNWSKRRVEINVSQYNPKEGREVVKNFVYKFNDPLPKGMRHFQLKNNQVVSVQVKRRPSFVDYIRVIAPIISTIATSFLIIQRL